MVDITISRGTTRPFSLKSLATVIEMAFARYRWNRFRHAVLPMSDRMLADIGLKRSDLTALQQPASTFPETGRGRATPSVF